MNGIILAVIGQAVIGLSIVIDKLFLKERDSSNVFAYVFWIGALNFFSIFLLPFGFIWPQFFQLKPNAKSFPATV